MYNFFCSWSIYELYLLHVKVGWALLVNYEMGGAHLQGGPENSAVVCFSLPFIYCHLLLSFNKYLSLNETQHIIFVYECVSLSLSICILSIHLCIYLSVPTYLYLSVSINKSMYLSIHLSIYISIHLSIFLSFYLLSIYLSNCLYQSIFHIFFSSISINL